MKIFLTILFSFILRFAFAQTGEVVKGNKHYKEVSMIKPKQLIKKH